jgi:RNA polymerase sigma-70 factor (ECF subfamily)
MDDEIRALVGQGQRDAALARLLPAYRERVFGLCLGILGEAALAEDVAQEVFVKIWRGLASFDGRSNLSTWIYAIARNAAISARRARRQHDSLCTPEVLASAERAQPVDTQAADEASAMGPRLRAWLAQLPDKERQVLTLFYLQDSSHEDLSAMLGMPIGTVKNLLHRGRERLRQLAEVSV